MTAPINPIPLGNTAPLKSDAVLATYSDFYTLPLRLTAIASNVAFIAYAWLNGLTPILLLHGALLPLNVLRLVERRR